MKPGDQGDWARADALFDELLDLGPDERAARLDAVAAEELAYTDVDISTDLAALPRLLRAVAEDGADVAIGSRRLPGSDVTRSPGREILSRAYNALVRAVFWTRFRDAQCGLKAVSRRVVEELVPRVAEQRWLFDTELLVRAERRGWPVAEIPVRWVHDPDSRVRVLPAAWEVVRGVLRLRLALWREPIEGARRRVRRAGA